MWGYGTPNCTLAVLDDFANSYPKTVEAYLTAVHRAFELIVGDPERAVELVVQGNYYQVEDEILLAAFQTQTEVNLRPNREGILSCIRDMVAQGYIDEPETDIMRLEFLDQVEATR